MGFFSSKKPVAAEAPVPEGERVSVGVVGVGNMGRHHARLLSGLPVARLVGVADPDLSRAQALAKEHRTHAFARAEEFPADTRAVIIAAPTPTHFPLAKSFLNRGWHCFIEKPLTERVEDAEEIIELARQKNLVLQVGHIERFNPAVVEMARQAKDPLFIEASRLGPFDPRVAHVGVVLDLMIHDIDIVLALAQDKVVRLDAVGGRVLSAHEDIVKATLFFSRGCRADISASRVSLKKFRKIRVFQKDAYLSLDYSERSLKIYRKKKDEIKSLLDIAVQRPRLEKKDPLESELRHFLQCVRDGKAPLVSGSHGRDALELALEIRRSLRLHSL
jgi:predicted dehydrogenase